jgi:NADPH:quinone reductase-like Zn-dependent oxidoreductase
VKAIRFHAHGGPDVLRYEDVDDPVPGPCEALVRVRACALNHLDLWQRRGIQRVRIPLPHTSGSDVAGEVVSSPRGGPPAGTRVMLQPGLSCGICGPCLSGADNFCARYDVLGYKSDGGYAELVKVPAANLLPIPETLDWVRAAAFPLTFLTVWHMLVTRARIQAGEWVLVLAAGSGVGQAAIQVARFHGARVIATAGTAAKRQHAADMGADAALDHHAPSLVDDVRALTGGRGVDVVVEHVGEATWERSVRALARGGRLVTCGATTGANAPLDLRVLFARQISLLGSYMGSKGELLQVAAQLFAGRVTPVVDSVFPLARASEAQARLESGEHFGKVVLET